MKVELTPDAEQWVKAVVAAGKFATAEDAVRFAINQAKLEDLRAMLDATEVEGGMHSADEARRHVREHLDKLSGSSEVS